ncbi:MAG: DUF1194 domain-containing protein [Verrucomicrobiota bacterium]
MAASGWLSPARAESVDSEIILLVDIVRPELSNTEFSRLMDSYATTFTSNQVLNSIQSGVYGRIAVSVMLFGGTSNQVVGIPWMSIGNSSQAATFASLVRNLTRPSTFAYSDPGSALTAATFSFGTETGGTSNGYESAAQIIEVASSSLPSSSMAASTAASSANALASGVDLINAVALGNFSSSINSFYAANVIGSSIDGVMPSISSSNFNGALASTVTGMLTESVQTGVAVSVTSVPEPSSLTGLLPATLLLLRRRRR